MNFLILSWINAHFICCIYIIYERNKNSVKMCEKIMERIDQDFPKFLYLGPSFLIIMTFNCLSSETLFTFNNVKRINNILEKLTTSVYRNNKTNNKLCT